MLFSCWRNVANYSIHVLCVVYVIPLVALVLNKEEGVWWVVDMAPGFAGAIGSMSF